MEVLVETLGHSATYPLHRSHTTYTRFVDEVCDGQTGTAHDLLVDLRLDGVVVHGTGTAIVRYTLSDHYCQPDVVAHHAYLHQCFEVHDHARALDYAEWVACSRPFGPVPVPV